MASIKLRKTKNGENRYYVQVRLHGQIECDTFERITDARKWIQDTESAIRDGRHFRTVESKKHTLGQMIDRYMENVLPLKEKCLKRQGAKRARTSWGAYKSDDFYDTSSITGCGC